MQIARRLQLRLIPELRDYCGGEAIEKAAAKGNPEVFKLTMPILKSRDCNFSFSGMKTASTRHIIEQEIKHGL